MNLYRSCWKLYLTECQSGFCSPASNAFIYKRILEGRPASFVFKYRYIVAGNAE